MYCFFFILVIIPRTKYKTKLAYWEGYLVDLWEAFLVIFVEKIYGQQSINQIL